jgi:hypothetical protein
MSRSLLVDAATGAILSTIGATSDEAAALYAGTGQIVMAITDDTGAHVNDAAVEVDLETGEVVNISGGAPATGFETAALQEVTAPE